MAECPVCGQTLQEDFGLVNCSSCGSPVLLGMDGEVGVPDAPPPPPPEPLVEPETFQETLQDEVLEEFTTAEPPTLSQEVASIADTSDMSDVVEYANSSESSGAEGNLKFNLKISGIDSNDIKRGVKEILLDSKLHLDPDETIERIESGQLFLEGLSAVKCAILVQRLKGLSLDIDWEQYAIQQA